MTHTWDLHLYYHECPECGFIIESRKDFAMCEGKLIKKLSCPRCNHSFTLERQAGTSHKSPLFGKRTKPEFDWL